MNLGNMFNYSLFVLLVSCCTEATQREIPRMGGRQHSRLPPLPTGHCILQPALVAQLYQHCVKNRMARRLAGICVVRRGGSPDGSVEAWKGLIYVASVHGLRSM
jgi:hypothetical protein